MMRWVPVLAAIAVTAACNTQTDEGASPAPAGPAEDVSAGESPMPEPAESAAPVEPEIEAEAEAEAEIGGARSITEETDDFLFEYAYPEAAGRIPELAALLDSRLDERREDLATGAADARRRTRGEGFPYNKHSYMAEWKVVADLPDWLSLSNTFHTYTGGAHGMYGVTSLVWDKEREEALEGIDLFASPRALDEALGERFCEALNREREKRREAPVDPESDDIFTNCPEVEDLTVLLGSSSRRAFDRLTLYAGPYVAGPYAEGAYEVDLRVDVAVLDAVRPEYRESFAGRN